MEFGYLLLAIATLLPLLMIASYIYAMRHQDVRAVYTVILESRTSVSQVVADHVRSYKIDVVKVFDSSVKGYTASVPVRNLGSLQDDPRVMGVEPEDRDEAFRP